MSNNSQINIQGDGNALGDGNKVTIIKNTKIINNNGGGSGDSNNNKKEGDGNWVFPAGVLLALLVASLAYWFSKHADTIYAIEISVGLSLTFLACGLMFYSLSQDDQTNAVRNLSVMAIAGMLAIASKLGWNTYDVNWISLAERASTLKPYWCALSFHDQVASAQLAIQSIFLIGPTTIFAAIQVFFAFTFTVWGDDFPDWFINIGEKLVGINSLVTAAVLAAVCLGVHTDVSFEFAQENLNTHSSIICTGKTR